MCRACTRFGRITQGGAAAAPPSATLDQGAKPSRNDAPDRHANPKVLVDAVNSRPRAPIEAEYQCAEAAAVAGAGQAAEAGGGNLGFAAQANRPSAKAMKGVTRKTRHLKLAKRSSRCS